MDRLSTSLSKEQKMRPLRVNPLSGDSMDENDTIDARSSSLVSVARTTRETTKQKDDERAAAVDSSSSSGVDQAALNASDRDSSTANGSTSRNIVTATQTTSSGEDRDSGTVSTGGASVGITPEYCSPSSEIVRHHNHHRSRHRGQTNDGSALQVPGDDGSNRLAGGPATVVASRLLPPNSDTTTNASSSGSGGEGETKDSLLEPLHKPDYHTIKRTFSKLPRRESRRGQRSSATDCSSSEDAIAKKAQGKHAPTTHGSETSRRRAEDSMARSKASSQARGRSSLSLESIKSNNRDGDGGGSSSGSGTEGGSSSGSGTEGGYAGSASSNELSGEQHGSCSSPSISSSEGSRHKSKSKRHRNLEDNGQRTTSKQGDDGSGDSSASSEIADFSSGNSDDGEDAGVFTIKTVSASPSAPPPLPYASNDLEMSYIRAKREAAEDQQRLIDATERKRKAVVAEAESWKRHRMPATATSTKVKPAPWPRARIRVKDDAKAKLIKRTSILNIGSDIMAHVLTFLQPPEILDVLTMPLSKDWRQNFTSQPELWRVLCLVEPFKARIEDEDDSSSSESFYSLTQRYDSFPKRFLDRYRLMYTSFVRCMKYLSQIREDAIDGRPPSYIDYGVTDDGEDTQLLVGTNKSLHSFLARARGVVVESRRQSESVENREGSEEGPGPAANTFTNVARTEKVRFLIECFLCAL